MTGQPNNLPGATGSRVNRGIGRGPNGGQPGIAGTGRGPGAISGQGTGRGPGRNGQGGTGRGPGNARQQWNQNWHQHHGNWNHNGNWGHNNHWNWNNSNWWGGFFFYPGFAFGLGYGYWGFDDCGAYCTYSPFYYYGYPYVYAPRVAVADVPDYSYTQVPDYTTGDYYLAQGAYSGLNAALDDIRNGFLTGQPNLVLSHISAGTQVQIYLDRNYAYSLPGADYQKMVQDAVGHIKTSSFTFTNVEQRSDGAYTATGTQVFTDVKGVQKTVQVSFTLAQSGNDWVIVAAGSSAG